MKITQIKSSLIICQLSVLIGVFFLSCEKLESIIKPIEDKQETADWVPDNDVNKWKGITWGGSWQKWEEGEGDEFYNSDGVASDIADIKALGVNWVRLAFKVGDSLETELDPKIDAAIEAGANILLRYTKGAPF